MANKSEESIEVEGPIMIDPRKAVRVELGGKMFKLINLDTNNSDQDVSDVEGAPVFESGMGNRSSSRRYINPTNDKD